MKINKLNNYNFYGHIEPSKQNTAPSQNDVFIKTTSTNTDIKLQKQQVLNEIIDAFKQFEETNAIAIGGSSAINTDDKASDIDVYVFVDQDIDIKKRAEIIKKYSSKYEIGCEYFGPGDEFYVDKMDKQLDLMYFNKQWFEDNFNNVWVKHIPSNGYTTCFLHTLNVLNIAYDKNGWLENLKQKLQTPYPLKLQENIIKRNMMLLKDKPFASYFEQLEKAIKRNDFNSINHRSAAFLASYFDIIFFTPEKKDLLIMHSTIVQSYPTILKKT